MNALDWIETTGGTHFCQACLSFVIATVARPVYRVFKGNVSTLCACIDCCVKAGG